MTEFQTLLRAHWNSRSNNAQIQSRSVGEKTINFYQGQISEVTRINSHFE